MASCKLCQYGLILVSLLLILDLCKRGLKLVAVPVAAEQLLPTENCISAAETFSASSYQ